MWWIGYDLPILEGASVALMHDSLVVPRPAIANATVNKATRVVLNGAILRTARSRSYIFSKLAVCSLSVRLLYMTGVYIASSFCAANSFHAEIIADLLI